MPPENPLGDLRTELATLSLAHQLLESRMEREFDSHVVNHQRSHELEQHAADLALTNMNRRLEGMNEFRAQMADTESKYSTKAEAKATTEKLEMSMGGTTTRLEGQFSAISERIRLAEAAAIALNARTLGTDFAVSVTERFDAVRKLSDERMGILQASLDARLRALERLVYMASGALGIIMVLLNFLKK